MGGKTMQILLGLLAIVLIVIAAAIGKIFVSGSKNPTLWKEEIVLGGEVFNIETARTINEKALGLSGREALGEREGMIFLFGEPGMQSFWMKDMLFPIDIIWINGMRIVGFSENVQPEPGKKSWELRMYSSPESVDKVLEVRAGTVARLGIKVGDEILLPL